jgi:hypothetical protein
MQVINNPEVNIIRGDVMIMLMRADEDYEGLDCEEILAVVCEDEDSAECKAAQEICKANGNDKDDPAYEVKAGDLSVSLKSATGRYIPQGVAVKVGTYTLKASGSDINIAGLTFEQAGYGKDDTLTGIALFVNGQRVSKVKNIDPNKSATLSFTTSYDLKKGDSLKVDVYALVGVGSGATNTQFALKLKEISSSAEDTSLDLANTDTFNVLGENTAKTLTIATKGGLDDVKVGDQNASLYEFGLTANDGDTTLDTITFVSDKDAASYFKNIELEVDNKVVATAEFNGKYVTFNLKTPYLVEKNRQEIFTVKGDVVGGADRTSDVTINVENIGLDIIATDVANNAPAAIAGSSAIAGIKILAGRVTIERANPDVTTFTKNRSNLYLGSFTINNNAGGKLRLTDFKLVVADSTGAIDNLKVKIGSTTAGSVELDNVGGYWVSDYEYEFSSKATVYLYADIKDIDVKNATIQITALSGVYLEETTDDTRLADTDISYPASWVKLTGKEGELNISTLYLADKTVAKGATDIEALQYTIKVGQAYGVRIRNITFTSNTGLDSRTVASATLYRGTTKIATVNPNGAGDLRFSDAITIDAGTTAEFTLKVNLASNPIVTGGFAYQITGFTAEDTSADRNSITSSSSSLGRTITVASEGSVSSDYNTSQNANAKDKSILAGTTEQAVAEYLLLAKQEEINVNTIDVAFSGTDLNKNIAAVSLYYDNKLVATENMTSNPVVTFDDIDLDLLKEQKALTVKISTRAIDENNGTGVAGVIVSGIVLRDLVGKVSGNPVADYTALQTTNSKIFDIVPVTIVAANGTDGKFTLTTSRGSNTDVNGISAKATLTGITFSIEGNNGSLDSFIVQDRDGNTIANVTSGGVVTLTGANPIILNDGTNNFTVVPTINSSVNTISYRIVLKSVQYTTNTDANTYSSRGDSLTLLSK